MRIILLIILYYKENNKINCEKNYLKQGEYIGKPIKMQIASRKLIV